MKKTIAVATVLCILTGCSLFTENEQEYRQAYSAWIKINGKTDVSFDEWRSLVKVAKKTNNDAMLGAVVGMTAANIAMSGARR